ncbi:hypothetical protein NLJ89_g9609 [Agrocybe chaxingu]|uniref:cellulase n=1 Tax=Agrocybe chaxingu TaxID=84603 RepID=A0A9W8MRN5_9AGAR|nr:hypothetical protein NLJ89_g9609 [Agrocybe chaxingu]
MNTFRIPFKLERLSPLSSGLTGSFDQTYLNGLKTIVNYITGRGAFAVVEPHNYMRYNGNVITSTSDFQTWWTRLANEFKSNNNVIFDIMNEPHTMDAGVVFQLNQAAVNGIRSTGATQLILVEGTAWTGAWSWVSSGNAGAFQALSDPGNNIAVGANPFHCADVPKLTYYPRYQKCINISTLTVLVATQWLKDTGFKGFLGEMGAGSNSQCIAAIRGALCTMQTSGVWIGFTWWAAGPWWGTYFQSIEPPNGPSIAQVLPQALKPFI